jgi:PAS domain S-box-containing protein
MHVDEGATGEARESEFARWLAISAIVLTVPSLVGWALGIPRLVQPLDTFAPARLWGTLMIPAGALGLIAKLSNRRPLARKLAIVCALTALAGLVQALRGSGLPFDALVGQRVGLQDAPGTRAIPLSISVLFIMYSAALWLLAQNRLSERRLLVVGALGSVQVALSGVLFMTQLAGLLDGTAVQLLRAPLHGLLAALLLGIALLQRMSVREQVPLAPPRWAPMLGGASVSLVVLVLWQALVAREEAQTAARAALTAEALNRAVQRQFRAVSRALTRTTTYLSVSRRLDDPVWETTLPRLTAETDGLVRILWMSTNGTMLRQTPTTPMPSAVEAEVTAFVRATGAQPSISTDPEGEPSTMPLRAGPWRLMLWKRFDSPVAGPTVIIGVMNEAEMLNAFVEDASREFSIRVTDGKSVLLQQGNAVDGGLTVPLMLGTHRLEVRVAQRPGAVRSPLPDVVLALGLAVALLLAMTLWLQRRIWEQASVEGMARMQRAIEGATDGVWELDVQHGRTHRSPGLLRYLGIDALVLDGGFAAWSALIHPDDAARVSSALEAHLRGEREAFECEYRLRAGDGSWHTLVDRGRIVERLPDGRPLRLLGISADVTERSRAEAAREESERRFRAMFDTAYQVQLLLDLDGSILEANRAAADLAQRSGEQLQGVSFWDVPWWGGESLTSDRVQERFVRARGGDTQRFEVEVASARAERPLTVDFSLKPIVDGEGRVAQVLAEGRDLTIRKRAEESLREISTLTTMGQLAARVAHEINNPLAGIQNAFLLIRGAIPTDHPHYRFVGAIEREIARIAAVTRQLYETYRPDQLMANQASVILAISDAVSFLEQVNRVRQVRIITDVTDAPSLLPVPDALLRQTLYNLVQNAMDVSPPNGTITVTARRDGDQCVLCVADEGPGIPMAIRERIFDPFFSTKDRTMKTGGMGIGLALVRQSVLAVGGRIEVRDRVGGGTEFEVRLPMTPLDTGVLR